MNMVKNSGNEDNHGLLRTAIAQYYRGHWSSTLNVRHKNIEEDGEWVEDPHIIAAAAFLKVNGPYQF